ncbi:MAG: TIGR00159 family protein [Candidatus Cloacimonas sp. 4484_140]|nr:MAG: TIGR00159 family protein [Candidatus Cloacimonas sp. 4484_140]HHI87509.1 TIGR00159 family protein [Candidatus Cloacimonadota bacterium]
MSFLVPNILDVLDILVVAYIIYRIILLVHGSQTYQIVWGLILVVIIYFVAELLNLTLLGSIVRIIRDIWAIALVVLFQPEIRSALIKFGQKPFVRSLFPQKSEYRFTELLNTIRSMSYSKIGGIFVLVEKVGLDDYVVTGEVVDAKISEKLILTIFNKRTVLHDGAMVIKDNRIVAAKVILPLTNQTKYVQKYGTRHQAAIGISEQTDAFVIVVSEETGKISTAKNGTMKSNVSIDILTQTLMDEFE